MSSHRASLRMAFLFDPLMGIPLTPPVPQLTPLEMTDAELDKVTR